MRDNFEAFQKGNPHRLTRQQHVFPAASIQRFQGRDGCVQVFRVGAGNCFSAKPNNPIFVAQRVWDEKAENGIGKNIEDKFQYLAEGVVTGRLNAIGLLEKPVVEEFYSLWRTRYGFKYRGLPDMQVNRVSGNDLSKDEAEVLESKHTMYIRADGTMPGRLLAGVHIFGYYNRFRDSAKSLQWGIVRSADGEFVVPDCFHDLLIIPVSPSILIMADQPNSWLTKDEVAVVNRCAIERSEDYYFARNFGSCPIYSINPPRIQRLFARPTEF